MVLILFYIFLLFIKVDGANICGCIRESLKGGVLPELRAPELELLGYSKIKDGTWISPDRPPNRLSPDFPSSSQSIPNDRTLVHQVFPEFIRKMMASPTPSTRKLAKELQENHNPGKANDPKWLTTWENIRDKFNKNVDPDSQDYKDGMAIINRAIFIGQNQNGESVTMPPTYTWQLPNEAKTYVTVPPTRGNHEIKVSRVLDFESIRLPPERPLDTMEILDFTKSEEYRNMLQDYIFCLDFSRGIVRLETDEHIGFYVFNHSIHVRVSKIFMHFLNESESATLGNLTEKYVKQLECMDPVTHKNWSNIWTEIERDFPNAMDQNTSREDGEYKEEDIWVGMKIIQLALDIVEMFHNVSLISQEKATTRMDLLISTMKPLDMEERSIRSDETTRAMTLSQTTNTADISYGWFAIILVPLFFIVLIKAICIIIKKTSFIVDFNKLTIIRRVGAGNFSHVYLVQYRPDDNQPNVSVLAAAKLLVPQIWGAEGEVEPSTLTESLDCFVDEVIIRKLNHTNIVKIYGMCVNFDIRPTIPIGVNPSILVEKCTTIAMIFEYVGMGDLGNYLQRKCSIAKTSHVASQYLQIACSILIGITDAFLYLKHQKVVHRDLACRNILVQSGTIAKVGDFGKAKIAAQKQVIGNQVLCAFVGDGNESLDLSITAPEAKEKHLFTSSSDVYAFGHLIAECTHLMLTNTVDPEGAGDNLDGPERTNVVQINEERPDNLADVNSNKFYQPVQLLPSMCEAEQTQDPSVQNMTRSFDPDAQKVIDQLHKLASSCLKKEIHERITFKELRIKLRALMKNTSGTDSQTKESII